MRPALLYAVLAMFALPTSARAVGNALAAEHKIGIGLGGGSGVTGASGKTFLSDEVSAQATVGHSWGRGIAVGVDGLLEMPQVSTRGPFAVNWYLGAGATLFLAGGVGLAVAPVLGASLQAHAAPVEITAEYRPTFVVGEAGAWLWSSWGAAARYYF